MTDGEGTRRDGNSATNGNPTTAAQSSYPDAPASAAGEEIPAGSSSAVAAEHIDPSEKNNSWQSSTDADEEQIGG